MRESEARYRSIFDSVIDAIFIICIYRPWWRKTLRNGGGDKFSSDGRGDALGHGLGRRQAPRPGP